ncbi:hypothetical protein GCM10025863_20290 [Microbacterium suwonense]|uniref:Uncharacterized protein n=1 Tax=Microbacterium suwonense TaxID=683047 RepID=A0ABN6X3S5_9MICO|nr:hypothetical protein GCM10025863_20290 [Microbacterium suwonense]
MIRRITARTLLRGEDADTMPDIDPPSAAVRRRPTTPAELETWYSARGAGDVVRAAHRARTGPRTVLGLGRALCSD